MPPKDIDISFDKYRLMIAKEWDKLSSADQSDYLLQTFRFNPFS
jgi:hypothetical protein